MGAVSIDTDRKARALEEKYILYEAKGIKKVIKEFYNIKTRIETKGDFDGVILLVDLEKAIKEANLGNRQSQVLELNKIGYKQKEIAEMLGIDRKTVTATFNQACKKIAQVYQDWDYLGSLLPGGHK
ncbi:MAG: LuxR C-terminal-related transcriptional regulator [Bacillota bacterium]